MPRFRPTWVEISSAAFLHNIRALKNFIGPTVSLIPVLKADAYGHGASLLASWVERENPLMIGVSSLEEAIALQDAGIKTRLLLLGGIYPLENFSAVLERRFIPTVASLDGVQGLNAAAEKKGLDHVSFHLKIDTGMGRIGISMATLPSMLAWLKKNPRCRLEGVYTHLACADSDASFTQHQLTQFHAATQQISQADFRDVLAHVANSAGILCGPQAHFQAVRPGLLMYGLAPVSEVMAFELKPVLSWKSRAIFLKKVPAGTSISYGRTYMTSRESDIITIPAGYADGVPRHLSNNGFVLVRGRRCPIVGRVTMDHFMVDVTGLQVSVGEPVVLIGEQQGQTITATDWAHWAGTISYEIVCGISKRVPREVVES